MHTQTPHNRFNHRLRYAFQAACVMFWTLFSSIAFALPSGEDKSENLDLHTIWVVGDVSMVEEALKACAYFFGKGGMWGMLKVAAILMLMMMMITAATKRSMQTFNYIIMFVLMVSAFNIKTNVIVASYFDGNRGMPMGVAKHGNVIGDVPIGVAYPLMLFSKMSRNFTGMYDEQMQALPELRKIDSSQLKGNEGGMMIHGTEGFFSPLKTIISLRWRFNSPRNHLVLKNLQANSEVCNWKTEFGKYADQVGTIAAISNPNQSQNGGARVYFEDGDYQASCTTAGRIISLMMIQNVLNEHNNGNFAVSSVAQDIAKRRIAASKSGTKQDTAEKFVSETQNEIDLLPNIVSAALGGKQINRQQATQDANRIAAEIERVKKALIENDSNTQPRTSTDLVDNTLWQDITGLNPTAWTQKSEAISQISASTLQAEILFGNVIEKCATSEGSTACYQAVSLMTEAKTHAVIDSAGEAGMFQHYGPMAMNVLLFIYVVMTPIIAVVIMAKGIYGWKLVGSYLLFAVWVNSWLPLSIAISYYMEQNFIDKLSEVLLLVDASKMTGAVYSPTMINAILDGAQDIIGTASVFMATVPMLMFAILTGSAYGFVNLAQKAAMTGKDFIDESKIAPTATEDANLGVQQVISAMSRGGPISSTNSTDLGNAFFDNAAIHSPVKMSIDNTTGIMEQYSDNISHSEQAIEDYLKGTIHLAQIQDGKAVSSGDVLQVQDGKMVGIKHVEAGETVNTVSNDGTVSIYAGADGKATASVSAANKMYAKEEVSAGLSTPVGGAKVAAGAEQSFTTQGTLEGSVGAGMRGQESWGTSANVSIKSGDTAERAMNSTETIGSNSSIMVNGQEIDSHSVQEAMTQRIAEEQNKVASYQHSMNTMASQSARAEVSLEHFQNVGFENHRTQMEKGAEVVQHLAETHPELRESANQLSYLAESGKLQRYAEKVQELWTNPETRMAGNAALSAYFDGTNSQNIANVAQSALNAQLKAEQEIGAKHGDYDKEINVKENVVGNFANPIDPVKVQSDLTQQFNDSPLMQKVSHNISNAQTNIEQEKQAMSEQVSGSLKEKHETTNTTAAGLMVKDIAADMGDDAKAFQESVEKGDYKAALGTAKDWVTPGGISSSVGGTSSMFRTPEPTTSSVAHESVQQSPQSNSQTEMQQAEYKEPVEKPLSGSINSERQAARQDDTQTANSQEPAHKPFWENGDSTVLHNAQQNPTADSQADKQVNTSVDTAKSAEHSIDKPQSLDVPEYLRQPESSGSVANEPKQDEPKHTPFAENSAENSLSGSLNNATAQQTEQSLSSATPSVQQQSLDATQQSDMAINSSTTPQTDAWQYRQQGQYQDSAVSENGIEKPVSGSLNSERDSAQSEASSSTPSSLNKTADSVDNALATGASMAGVETESWGDKAKDAVGNAAVKAGIAEPIYTATLDMPNQSNENAQDNQQDKNSSGSLKDDNQGQAEKAEQAEQADKERLNEQARDEENERQRQADEQERRLAQHKAEEEKAAQEEQRKAEEQQKAEEERKAEEQRRAEELKKEQEQEKATLDAMNKKLTPQTDAWAFTDPDKLKELQEQGLVDKPVVEDPLINHNTGAGVGLKSPDYEINNLKDKNGKVSFKGFGAGIDKSIKEASETFGVDEKDLRGFLKIERGWYGDPSSTGCIGPGQFTIGTWNALARKPEGKAIGMKIISEKDRDTDNDQRRDPHINVMATAFLMKDNSKLLKGLPPTGENLYMVHNVGPAVVSVLKGSNYADEKLETSMRQNGKRANETPQQWVKRQIGNYQTHYKIANDWYEKNKK